jgi:hypothetical protein
MTNESKKLISTICIYASLGLFIAAIYGKLMAGQEPRWSKLAYTFGVMLVLVNIFLTRYAKRGS